MSDTLAYVSSSGGATSQKQTPEMFKFSSRHVLDKEHTVMMCKFVETQTQCSRLRVLVRKVQ